MILAFRHSISRKLMLVVLATTFLALLVSAAAMLFHDLQAYRNAWVNDLTTQAEILARVSAPALEFDDPKVASDNLNQLKARERILSAAIYTPGGALFAGYSSENTVFPRLARFPRQLEYTIKGGEITVFHPIWRSSEIVGGVYLHARYDLQERVVSYAVILLGVMAGSLLLAAIIGTRLQAAITKPILAVSDTAHEVIRRRDFSLRVEKTTEDEIGVLVDAFNGMLSEVGQRAADLKETNDALTTEMKERGAAEEALRKLNDTLEQRIATRTAELEAAHEQLRQAQKMEAVGQLTGGIAHDFNNLLGGVVANLEMMQVRIAQGRTTDLARYIQSAMSSADRAAALTHRLLAFSRRQKLDPKPTDINELVSSMEDLIRRSVGPAIQLDIVRAPKVWRTMCDPHQLENALLNLAINARDAMPKGGRLTIETRNSVIDMPLTPIGKESGTKEYVSIGVTDTGVGMTPDVLARAFDPFFTTKPIGQGTGLGLSMVYGFANQSGGFVRMESEPGKGTTVRIHLPRHEVDTPADRTVDSAPRALRAGMRENVLLVDDEAPLRQLVTEMLEDLGYSVTAAEDGPQALGILQSSRRFDLLVSDVGLPKGMNGRQLAEAARALRPSLKVLFITGYPQAASLDERPLAPGMDLMTKPFKMDVFAAKVGEMMELAGSGPA